jgi:hypothetical protein
VVLAMGWDAVGGSAGTVLRSQGSSGEDRPLRCAQVFLWIASSARSGPIPLPPGWGGCPGRRWWGLRGIDAAGAGVGV